MRNKPDIDQTDINDLYNNLTVYEDEMKRSSSSTSNSQNFAFLSSENTSSTNEVSIASGNFRVNTAGGTSSTNQVLSTPGADEVVCSFFAQQTTSPPLNNEDLQQIDQDDLEELDIRWQVAMLTVDTKVGRSLIRSGRNQGKRSNDDNGRRNAASNEPSSQAWSQMSVKDKNGLGYDTQLDEISNKSETDSEISMSVFEVRSSDEETTLENDRFSKADRPKSKNAKVRVNTEESAVKPEPELKNTIECNLYPSDGPGKPNSISMKTVKTKWALNHLQQPICVQLTKTVKTLKAQS
ncbi:hypothetical protein Tco_0668708 [Tanacetum coccineum]